MTSVSKPNQALANELSVGRRAWLAAVTGTLVFMKNGALAQSHHARTAIKTVVPFDKVTWPRLLRDGPRPAAYVFTTTYCPTCPEAFETLNEAVMAAHKKVELAAVVMDVSGAQALAHAHHYAGATRIYAFDGFEPEIRQTVDPKWRNVTPYIVLIDRQGAVQRSIGPPSAAQLKAWLA